MIFANSRYKNTKVERLRVSGKDNYTLFLQRDDTRKPFTYREYLTKGEERLELLAWKYYQDPEMWYVIAEANPELTYPDNIPYGLILRIPNAPPTC